MNILPCKIVEEFKLIAQKVIIAILLISKIYTSIATIGFWYVPSINLKRIILHLCEPLFGCTGHAFNKGKSLLPTSLRLNQFHLNWFGNFTYILQKTDNVWDRDSTRTTNKAQNIADPLVYVSCIEMLDRFLRSRTGIISFIQSS